MERETRGGKGVEKREMQVVAMKVWELRIEPGRMKDKDREQRVEDKG